LRKQTADEKFASKTGSFQQGKLHAISGEQRSRQIAFPFNHHNGNATEPPHAMTCLTSPSSVWFAPSDLGRDGEDEAWPEEYRHIFRPAQPSENGRAPHHSSLMAYLVAFVVVVLLMLAAATLVSHQLPISEMAFL
jgi:hypothetical protein